MDFEKRKNTPSGVFFVALIFDVTDVGFFGGVKRKVADGRDKWINAASNQSQEKVGKGTRRVAFGFQRRVINHYAAYPARKKS